MAIQTIISLGASIGSIVQNFRAERDQVLGNANLSQEGKKRQFDALYLARQAQVTNSIIQLWGDLITELGGVTLDPRGAAWVEDQRLDRAKAEAKNQAERAGIDPAFFQIARTRAEGAVLQAGNPAEFMRLYADGSRDLRIAIQESGAALIGNHKQIDMGWNRVIRQIERDRLARLETPQVKAVQAEINSLIAALVDAHQNTKFAVDELGSITPVLNAQPPAGMLGGNSEGIKGIFQLIELDRRYISPDNPAELPYFEVGFHRLHRNLGTVQRLNDIVTVGNAYGEGVR